MKNRLFLLTFLFSILLAGTGYSGKGQITVKRGDIFPRVEIDEHMAQNDLDYLGLTKPEKQFSLFGGSALSTDDIKAEIIVIEFMNVHCFSCQRQTRVLNQLYSDIAADPKLRGRVKILGIASGNFKGEINRFKIDRSVPYPIMPDSDFIAYEALGDPAGTPITFIVKKRKDKPVILSYHKGAMKSSDILLRKINAYTQEIPDTEALLLKDDSRDHDSRPLKPDLPEKELHALVRKSMLTGARPAIAPDALKLEKIELPGVGSVFQGRATSAGKTVHLFSKIVSRHPVCDVCHGVHFIITFDSLGAITDFTTVHLTKAYNKDWDHDDQSFMRSRLQGKSLKQRLVFDPEVDSVSSATMTCSLIFNSVNHLNETYQALIQAGHIP